MSPIRLALLLCDTLSPAVKAVQGDYYDLYGRLLKSSFPPTAKESVLVDPFDVVHAQEYPDKDADYAAVILSGSVASAYQDLPWIHKLVAYVADLAVSKPHVKIIGICFGHQIVSIALGGACVPGSWEIAVKGVDMTPVGKEIFGVDVLNIQQMHRDYVPALPPSFHLLGSTAMTTNHGMVKYTSASSSKGAARPLTDIHILTVQGHPEYTEPIVATMINFREASGVLDAQTAEDARRRVGCRNDGVVFGRAIWGVLGVV